MVQLSERQLSSGIRSCIIGITAGGCCWSFLVMLCVNVLFSLSSHVKDGSD